MADLYAVSVPFDIVRVILYNWGVDRQEELGFRFDDVFVDVAGAAVLTGMGFDYIQKLCRLRKLHAVKIQGRWLIALRSLGDWQRKTAGRGRPPAARDVHDADGAITERAMAAHFWKLVDRDEVDTSGLDERQKRIPGIIEWMDALDVEIPPERK